MVAAAAVDMAAFGGGMGNRNTTDGHDGRLWRFCRWGRMEMLKKCPCVQGVGVNALPRPAFE